MAIATQDPRGEPDDHATAVDPRLVERFVNGLGDPVFVKDERLRWIFLNDPCVDLVGRPRSEVIGRLDDDLFSEPWSRAFRCGDESVLAHGRLEVHEHSLSRSDGEQTVAIAKSLVVDPESGRRYIIGTVHDNTERRRVERALVELGDAELCRVGKALHDEVGQRLTGVALLLRALIDKLETIDPADAETAKSILLSVRETIGGIRHLSRGLALVEQDETDLSRALRELLIQSAPGLGLSWDLDCPAPCELRAPITVTQLCRIAQEALTRAARSAGAKHAHIQVALEDPVGRLQIEDDGARVDETQGMHDIGLTLMRHRASVLGGSITMSGRAEGGTRVVCTFPLTRAR